ncbi:EAL domain-containing protein [Kaistia dalseonensis]|uniref:Diguanylate cyclase (GGDEF)-like protein/PAS domain S-box-containing protein n=1 Tax=Kaistia dalseonensis TaxID=410840 RepID=A0ABU0H744_9HYPH|nr:EAL domain-containing protein [Kaistia dalseonensis]MCX5495261.1 EAL domain-containing protein [Kaistia dalseonensis]MDQ0437847.1 diguanylate cyclase (GGDEF)-like protein/PAS domain S-box-containing protein [Kaistia dalseonensis]
MSMSGDDGRRSRSWSLAEALSRYLTVVTNRPHGEDEEGLATGVAAAAESLAYAVIEATPSALLLTNAAGNISFANSAAERLFGYEAGELVGRPLLDLVPPRYRDAHMVSYHVSMDTPVSRMMGGDSELFGLRKDGGEIPVEMALNTLELGGEVQILASIFDTSARHEAQREAAMAVAEAEAIVSSAPFAIIATDVAGLIVAVNPAAERLLWYREAELAGKASVLLLHDKAEIEACAAELSRELGEPVSADIAVFRAKASRGLPDSREWSYIRKGGSRVPVQLTVSAIRDQRQAITGFLGIAYDITDRKRADGYIRHIAHHDALTGLPNRVLLHERLDSAIAQASRTGGKIGVLLVDLDHFKRVNDMLGHYAGDQLLIDITQAMQRCVRSTDVLARMGGDEFVVLMPDVTNEREVLETARKIVQALSGPIQIRGHAASVATSVGVALYPDHTTDPQALLTHADMAMYDAKRRGGSHYRIFTLDMAHRLERQVGMQRALAGAMERGEFFLEYQPEVSSKSGRVIGVETLLRWRHATRGLVPPDEFIPIAEESGLIVAIGAWVLRTACAEIGALNKTLAEPLRLSVNVSPQQLFDEQMWQDIDKTLAKHAIAPHLFEIEITEASLMGNGNREQQVLSQLRNLGITITIDDFGTGYSSLSYLAQFSIDRIKIDRTFVQDLMRNPNRATIVSAIIAMARKLGIGLIAEGVETVAHLRWLEDQGCDEFQGFLFSAPVPAERLAARLAHLKREIPALFSLDYSPASGRAGSA